MARTFQKGDKVSFLDEVGTGVVQRVLEDGSVEVETEDGFDMIYQPEQLIHTTSPEEYEARPVERTGEVKAPVLPLKTKKKEDFLEIDLHIEELLDDWRHMTNTAIVRLQLEKFAYWMEEARERRIKRLIIIHGVGSGVLRSEIRKRLDEVYTGLEYFDASFREYGFGATEVRFRYS